MKKLIFLLVFLPNQTFAQTSDTLLPVDFGTSDTTVLENTSLDTLNSDTTLIDSLLTLSMKYKGVPYKYAGRDSNGFDCSGFVCHVYGCFGYELPTSSSAQALEGIPVKKDSVQPGDIVYFTGRNSKNRRVGHVGIVVSNEDGVITFIHASVNYGISTATTESSYYKLRYLGARRIIEE